MEQYDIIILVDSGIGNAIEALYSVEYCMKNNKKIGIFLNKINQSFQNYLKECYGSEIILENLSNKKANYLLHSFTYQDSFELEYSHYFYIQPDFNSSKYKSETEQYLEIVKALFPSEFKSEVLLYLQEDFSEKVKALQIETKFILYPGSTYPNAYKRWPHFDELILKLGEENVIVLGGNDDLNVDYSYIYPKYITRFFSQIILDNITFWRFLRKLNLLIPFSHNLDLKDKKYSFFNVFSWKELVAIFKRSKQFIGNDGGLSQLAGAAGATGLVIFGATSIEKNKAYNSNLKPISLNYDCQPCQFAKMGILAKKFYINCPYQIKCLTNLKTDKILENL